MRKRVPRQVANRVQFFKRRAIPQELKLITTAGIPSTASVAFSFQLTGVPASDEFGALFDQYKICAIAVRVVPRFTEISQGVALGTTPRCYYTIDYDDTNVITSEDDICQYAKSRVWVANRGFKTYFRPSCTISLYNSVATTAYCRGYQKWIDMGNKSVPHYGLKIFVYSAPDGETSTKYFWDVHFTYYLAMKFAR